MNMKEALAAAIKAAAVKAIAAGYDQRGRLAGGIIRGAAAKGIW